jgi:hypothetical protein
MLCCSFGGIVVGSVVVGEGFVFHTRWVVAIYVGVMVLSPIVIVLFNGVGVVFACECVGEVWGCGAWATVGLCKSVVDVFAAGVFVDGGAASFLGTYQKTYVAFQGLPPIC